MERAKIMSKSRKSPFAAAPEGTAALFFIDSLPPVSSPFGLGLCRTAPAGSIDSLPPVSSPFGLGLCRTAPAGSIQIFATLGFAVLAGKHNQLSSRFSERR
jgi:hypothetical protein